jgi:YggT family protein
MGVIAYLVYLAFNCYTVLLFAAVIGSVLSSLFPHLIPPRIMHFIRFYTEPYLGLFRRFIPSIGGIDISPLFAFLALRILEALLVSFLLTV